MGTHPIQKTIERFFDEKSDAKDRLLAILMERIESSVDHIIEEHTDRLVGDISDDLDMRPELSIDVGNEETVGAPFDMRGAFARGMAGLATVGGLSTWAASLGNMGGYMVGHILAIRGPSAASVVGTRLSGGVATATVRLSALGTGGPATLGLVAVAGMVALGTWRLLSTFWGRAARRKGAVTSETRA